MGGSSQSELTRILRILQRDHAANPEATDRVFQAAYQELRRLATDLMRRERRDHTLQPTALIHEAYLRLVDQSRVEWQSRTHFFGIASRAMREILVDHARRHQAAKRGGNWQRITLDENLGLESPSGIGVLDLDRLLLRLREKDERMAQVVELRVFGGLSAKEVGHLLGVSRQTVHKDWRVAKMWLRREFAGEDI